MRVVGTKPAPIARSTHALVLTPSGSGRTIATARAVASGTSSLTGAMPAAALCFRIVLKRPIGEAPPGLPIYLTVIETPPALNG